MVSGDLDCQRWKRNGLDKEIKSYNRSFGKKRRDVVCLITSLFVYTKELCVCVHKGILFRTLKKVTK